MADHIALDIPVTGDETKIRNVLLQARDAKYWSVLVDQNRKLSSEFVRHNLPKDLTLTYALGAFDQALSSINVQRQRLKTLLSISWPAAIRDASDEQLAMWRLDGDAESLGRSLSTEERSLCKVLLASFQVQRESRVAIDSAIERLSKIIAPNCTTLLGHMLCARMIADAGSLQKFAMMSASTIQMIGARKAVLRHLSTGSKNPKHGIIFTHPFVRRAKDSGRHARVLADKIAICAKVDFFKGAPVVDKILEELSAYDS